LDSSLLQTIDEEYYREEIRFSKGVMKREGGEES
jgi:hypothetical protein